MISQNINNENGLNELFENIPHWHAQKFVEILHKYDPNTKYNGVPILHFIVRNAGPAHIKTLIKSGANVNLLTDQNAYSYNPASALQWITGMMLPEGHHLGWPQNYTANTESSLVNVNGSWEETSFEGSPNSIMFEIAHILSKDAKLDFYSACALGYISKVEKYLKNPEWLMAPGPDGSSALAWAARRGQDKIISLLLQHGADVNQLNKLSLFTPLEEAILFHGTQTTVELLIQANAVIRQGIIGLFCKNRIDMLEFLLSHRDNPSQLITVDDMKAIQIMANYKEYLRVFAKYHVSLAEIDKEMNYQLIFTGCFTGDEIQTLRSLISLHCNLNGVHEDRNMRPLALLAVNLQDSDNPKEKLEILQKMAILFFHGSSVTSINNKQPHALHDLHGIDLISFLLFLYEEVKLNNEVHAFSKIESNSRKILKEKINEAFSYTNTLEDSQTIEFSLKKLLNFCDPNSHALDNMAKHGIFNINWLSKIKKYYHSSKDEGEALDTTLITPDPNSSYYADTIIEKEKEQKKSNDQIRNLKILNNFFSKGLRIKDNLGEISSFISTLPLDQAKDVLNTLRSLGNGDM